MNDRQTILTITGSDSLSESGVQADIKTIADLGGVSVSAITSVTVQNTLGIQEFYDLPAEIVRGQIEALLNDVRPAVIKIGLIRSLPVLDVIVDILAHYNARHVIYAPVFISSNHERLVTDDVVEQIMRRLVPLCSLVITRKGSVHGQGNVYASAVAFYLSEGLGIEEAQARAQAYVSERELRSSDFPSRSAALYKEFLALLDTHFRANSDVAFYASRLNVSSRYLAQVCRKLGLKSPKAFIDERLGKESERLLSNPLHTIQQVAYELGFSSQAHFSKFFKKITGQSPSEYRKSIAKTKS